jgi:rhodanese-related sulfurtransferase
MIRTLSPKEAEALIAQGGIDIVDVRDAHEWSGGHILNARLVPLDKLKQDPRAALPRDGILFVCARGMRSLAAAKVAEALGFASLYSIAGGTIAWANAGLPLVKG